MRQDSVIQPASVGYAIAHQAASEETMQTLTAVIAHGDGRRAEVLAQTLLGHFHRVDVTSDIQHLREKLARLRAQFAVVDLDLMSIDQLRLLCSEFSSTGVVCVHRAPDEEMWTRTVEAGALDCCDIDDLRSLAPRRRALAA
jgi:hypothetical protein